MPSATVIIFLTVDERTWEDHLDGRARRYDEAVGIAGNFRMQDVMRSALERYSAATSVPVLTLAQDWGDVRSASRDVLQRIADRLGT